VAARRADVCPEWGKVPAKQPKRGRLWLNDGSIVRLRAEFPKHVWSYDFMEDRTHDGVKFRILNVMDEFTRECLAVRVGRSLTHQTVIEVLTKLFCERGVPVHIRSDNGSEFTAKRVRAWFTSSRCSLGSVWRSNRSSSSQAVPGRTVTSSRSTARCAMSCWQERSFIL